MKLNLIAAASVLMLMTSALARADVEFTNEVIYFDVQGKTAAELYDSILAHSMKIEGKRTVASISTKLTQSGETLETEGACKVGDYKVKLNFVVARPEVTDDTVLIPADKENWEQMSVFIRSHEELHRQIWIGCAQALSDEVAALEDKSCQNVTNKTNALWSKMLADCDKKQRSFDDKQTRLLLEQPFYINAMRNRPTQ